MNTLTAPEITNGFRIKDNTDHEAAYAAQSYGTSRTHLPSPAYTLFNIILGVASGHRVAEVQAKDALPMEDILPACGPSYPESKPLTVIAMARDTYNEYGQVDVSPSTGDKFANLGKRILELNEAGAIQPPLKEEELAAVNHIVDVVAEYRTNNPAQI